MPQPYRASAVRIALIDDDSGLMTVLDRRFAALRWDREVIGYAADPEQLMALKIHALIVNPAITGLAYIEWVGERIPGLALLVCGASAPVAYPLSMKTARNVGIIGVLAAVLAFAPGGGTAGSVVLEGLYLAFLGAMAWVGSLMYRERRGTLYLLGDHRRALLYVAVGVVAVTLTATSRLWATPAGSVAWLILIGASIYVAFTVLWAARRY
jgi:hypothetical protein